MMIADIRVRRAMEPLLEQALKELEGADKLISDTGDVEDDELDSISGSITDAINKLTYYLGKL
jgi:hypothetical protein